MPLDIDQIPQINQFNELYQELEEQLSKPLFNRVVGAQNAIRLRLQLEIELRQFVTDKMINQAVNQ